MYHLIYTNLINQLKFIKLRNFSTINDTVIKNIISDLNECKNDEQTLKYYVKYRYFDNIVNNIYKNKDLHKFIFDNENKKIYNLYKEAYHDKCVK